MTPAEGVYPNPLYLHSSLEEVDCAYSKTLEDSVVFCPGT